MAALKFPYFHLTASSLQSPELLRLELKNAQTVIKIARSKLVNYLTTVRQHMGKQNSEELVRTLDGIEELCSFLDVKFVFPRHTHAAPIDKADEANERKQSNSAKSSASVQKKATASVAVPSQTAPSSSSGYVMPENAFMHSSTRRLLGDRREIELATITSDERPEAMVLQNGLPAAEPQQRPH